MQDHAEIPAAANLDYLEPIYAKYLENPSSVPAEWQTYFSQFENGGTKQGSVRLEPAFSRRSIFNPAGTSAISPERQEEEGLMQQRLYRLIRAYRVRGHIQARIDPLNPNVRYAPELDPQYYGFVAEDMDRLFPADTLSQGKMLTLQKIISRLRETYCGSIGFQYLHIDDTKMRHWIQERIEAGHYWQPLPREQQLRILTRLTDAVVFEDFLRRKFVGAKSFSLAGGESLLPLLDLAIERSSHHGVREIVVGMAHRGRLNVLANIIGKSPKQIFREFEDRDPDLYIGGGDVKYHLGYSSDFQTAAGAAVHLSLCFNPSHLEFVNPVVLGRVRAKQDRRGDEDRSRVLSLQIHGDAAFIGEGVIQETLNLSRLPGYRVGGTVHILINNQLGFTTAPTEGRSTMYATSVAKMLPAPILHVNGEDPEAVARCIQLAMDFRATFNQDVIIDMYCFRRYGHNEGDEPSFTQPLLYSLIEKRRSVRESYLEHLLRLGQITRDEADEIAQSRQEMLEEHLKTARGNYQSRPASSLEGIWSAFYGGNEPATDTPPTAVRQQRLAELLTKLTETPSDFNLHPKLQRFMDNRRAMTRGEQPLDWAAGEALALATLATEGYRIRFSGQDSERGTFTQRHAVLHDVHSGLKYCPLKHLAEKQGPVEIINSPLSETGVLGFEYGYSLDCPEGLVIWEAQFGDFVNAAQVIVDQFITSGEDKWQRLSGLVMLLPHGFEGAGPEHSSGRIERFLTLAAEDNIQVCVPTTPAQYFHLLRRQLVRKWRKPLVAFTPKSLLRHARAVSRIEECASGQFQKVIPDVRNPDMSRINRVLLCCGKLYYELEEERSRLGLEDIAIIRIEQLYPFPRAELDAILEPCQPGTDVIWVQEEPENMGAWYFLRVTVSMQFLGRLPFSGICRPASGSPATGSAAAHRIEQTRLLSRALAQDQPRPRPRTETIVGV